MRKFCCIGRTITTIAIVVKVVIHVIFTVIKGIQRWKSAKIGQLNVAQVNVIILKNHKVFLNQGSPKILKYVIKVLVQFLCFWNGQTLLDTWTEKSWNRWDVLWLLFHLICQGLEIRAIQDNPQHYALFLELVNGDGSNTFWQIQILHSEEDQLPLKELWSVWHNSSLGLKWKTECEWKLKFTYEIFC